MHSRTHTHLSVWLLFLSRVNPGRQWCSPGRVFDAVHTPLLAPSHPRALFCLPARQEMIMMTWPATLPFPVLVKLLFDLFWLRTAFIWPRVGFVWPLVASIWRDLTWPRVDSIRYYLASCTFQLTFCTFTWPCSASLIFFLAVNDLNAHARQ